MSKPPIDKTTINTLAGVGRGKVKSGTIDEGVRADLSKKGLIQDRLGSVSLTARGKMTLQRKNSVRRGRGGGGSGGGLV